MKNIGFIFISVWLTTFFNSCKEANPPKLHMEITDCSIDTLSGLEFAFKVKITKTSAHAIRFYTGLSASESSANDGFYLKFGKIQQPFQMISLVKDGVLVLSPGTQKQQFILNMCFREYCTHLSDFEEIYKAYYRSNNTVDNISGLLKDMSVYYKVNKAFGDENYNSVFQNDSIIQFKRLDTMDIKLCPEITGNQMNEMLKR